MQEDKTLNKFKKKEMVEKWTDTIKKASENVKHRRRRRRKETPTTPAWEVDEDVSGGTGRMKNGGIVKMGFS